MHFPHSAIPYVKKIILLECVLSNITRHILHIILGIQLTRYMSISQHIYIVQWSGGIDVTGVKPLILDTLKSHLVPLKFSFWVNRIKLLTRWPNDQVTSSRIARQLDITETFTIQSCSRTSRTTTTISLTPVVTIGTCNYILGQWYKDNIRTLMATDEVTWAKGCL